MKIAYLATSNSRSAGGLYYTMHNVLKQLKVRGLDVSIVSHNDQYSAEDLTAYGDVPNYPYEIINLPIVKSFGYSPDLKKVVNSISPDIVHIQGLWMYNSYVGMNYHQQNTSTIKIIQPHGMLDPWAIKNSAWKKKIVGYLFEYKNLRSADCLHALCEEERDAIRAFGLKNPIAVIPNGVNIPVNPIFTRQKSKKTLLYIGRLHPKKGLSELLNALVILKHKHPSFFENWTVRIAGWDQLGFQSQLQKQIDENSLQCEVKLIGSVFGTAKENEFCSANAFILPSFSEGLPMSILEAWSYRLPVVMTPQCNLPLGFEYNAAIKTEHNEESIVRSLMQLSESSELDLTTMGENGYNLVSKFYTWERVAEITHQLYNYLFEGGERPDFIYVK